MLFGRRGKRMNFIIALLSAAIVPILTVEAFAVVPSLSSSLPSRSIISNCRANRASTTTNWISTHHHHHHVRTTTGSGLGSSSSSSSTDDNTISEEESAAAAAAAAAAAVDVDVVSSDYKPRIAEAISILHLAAETKSEESDKVYQALADLEKLMREKAKAEGPLVVAEEMRDALNGTWQLVFTTGTAKSQASVGRINYLIPIIKAVQTFDTTNGKITNGVYVGDDFALVKFTGDFSFDLKKRKLEFDFDRIAILQLLDIPLKQGDASQFAGNTGLGNKYPANRKPFFNWINADEKIATARGGGGGLALWKRVPPS